MKVILRTCKECTKEHDQWGWTVPGLIRKDQCDVCDKRGVETVSARREPKHEQVGDES